MYAVVSMVDVVGSVAVVVVVVVDRDIGRAVRTKEWADISCIQLVLLKMKKTQIRK